MKFEVPFTGQYNTRVASAYPVAKDERFINCYLTKEGAKNYIQKRPGFGVDSTPQSGSAGAAIATWTGFGAGTSIYLISAFGTTNSTIYVGTPGVAKVSMGSITGKARSITEVGGVGVASSVIIASSDSSAWILTGQAASTTDNLEFLGDTHTNNTIDNILAAEIANMVVGQAISGSGIQAGTRIQTIGATSITTTLATTATAAGVTITRETLAKVIDADYPGNASLTTVGGFVALDGYVFIMTNTGLIYGSDLNAAASWTSNSYDSANDYPDYGVGLVRNKNMILAIGKGSTEVWYNAGLSPFPLARVKPQTMRVGGVDADAIAAIADTVFFCGIADNGGMAIFQYDGQISVISNPEINFQLTIAGASSLSLTTVRAVGKSFVVVRTASTTYVYIVEDKRWHEWSGTLLCYKACGTSIQTSNAAQKSLYTWCVSADSTSGKIYEIDGASLLYTDDGSAFTATAQSGNQDADGRWMFFNFLRVIADKESSTSTLTILSSDDDYANFTTLGTVDLSSMNTRIDRLGASQKRAWKITHASATPMRIEKLVGEMEVGS